MVEIIPKQIPGAANWLNTLFYLSLFLLLISIISFFLLGGFLGKNEQASADLDEALSLLQSPENLTLEKEVLSYQKKINSFSQLKGEHFQPSGLFEIIEQNSHPQVWFTQFNLETDQKKVTLAGKTQSFETLGQQLLIFQKAEEIREVNLEKVSISKESKIEFSLSFIYE